MTLQELRVWLEDKRARGVKQVRVTTMEESLPSTLVEALPDDAEEHDRLRSRLLKRDGNLGKTLRENATLDPIKYDDLTVQGVLVGTAEAAKILNVERPRLGRWQSLGMMPEPVATLAAGPVWFRADIEAYIETVNSRRKGRAEPSAAA